VLETVLQVLDKDPPRPRALDRAIDRDLETICLKCLEKQPEKRYASAAALADDLERWLKGEPVLARRGGPVERVLKWARRRPAAAALAGVSLAAAAAVGVALLVAAVLLNAKNAELTAQKARLEDSFRREKDARREEQRVFTAHRIFLADGQLRAGRPDEAEDLLDACLPADLRAWEWYYLKRQCHQDRATLRGASYDVSGVAFSPDGRRVAAADDANYVYVWDAETGRRLQTLRVGAASTSFCRSPAFSRDGRLLAAATRNGVKVWDAESGKELHSFAWDDEGGRPADGALPNAVSFSVDNKLLATCGFDGVVRVWDLEAGREASRLDGHFLRAEFVGDRRGSLFAFPAAGGFRIFDPRTHEELGRVNLPHPCWAVHPLGVQFAVYRPSGADAPGAGPAIEVHVLHENGRIGPRVCQLTAGIKAVHRLAFSGPGDLVAAVEDDAVKVWRINTASPPPVTLAGAGQCAAFSPDGKRLATAGAESSVKVWDVDGPPRPFPANVPAGGLTDLAYSPDGGLLAVARQTDRVEEVELWDARREERLAVLSRREVPAGAKIETAPVCLAFAPDGKRLAVGDGLRVVETTADGKDAPREPDVTVWETSGRRLYTIERAGAGVAWGPDGAWLATTTLRQGEKTAAARFLLSDVRVWNAADGSPARTLERAGVALAFSPDGAVLATAAPWPSQHVHLWATDGWRPLRDVKTRGADCMAFSPDGKRLATGNAARGGVEVHDVEAGRVVFSAGGRMDDADANGLVRPGFLAWSPDGRRLAGATDLSAVRLWDVAAGQEALALPAAGSGYGRLAFSPDGGRLTWLRDSGLTVWDGAPLPPERLYGRAARARVKPLYERLLSRDAVLEALQKEGLPGEGFLEAARAALDEAEQDAARLDEASWLVVSSPGADPDDYRLALRQSEAARDRDPDNPDTLNTLAAAYYRVGDDDGALKELLRARALRSAENPDDFLLLTLVRWRRGDRGQARADLDKARELMRRPEHKDDKQLQGLLHEAEATVGEERP
jgi:WD40 repeat protein